MNTKTQPPQKRRSAAAGRLVNQTTGRTLAQRVYIAAGWREKMIGLMGPGSPVLSGEDSALGLPHCDWIHTFFVPAPIDIAFCDNSGRVLRVESAVPPFRIVRRMPGAAMTWEMGAGLLSPFVAPGDVLVLEEDV